MAQTALSRKLHRFSTDKMIAGICGGIAETYGWNSTLIRVLFVLSFFLPGPQILLYAILWLVMPKF
ncbi:Phage shock protein C [Corynebacterium renale]|uniref:PspC domain-containing protein n=1 Tax=Corynebacterium renale TaxID=1724 RepID=UPI000DA36AF0|nr:PspC domain-containing protein [Corynebacterium renale]SQG64463.1 Phage shock protein C [Corynebacterium renale]